MGDALRAYEEALRAFRPQIGAPLQVRRKKQLSAPSVGASMVRPSEPIKVLAPTERDLGGAPLQETEEEKFQRRLDQERELGEVRSDLAAKERERIAAEPKVLDPIESKKMDEQAARAKLLDREKREKELDEQQKVLTEAGQTSRGLKAALREEMEAMGVTPTDDELNAAANVRQKRGEKAEDVRSEFKRFHDQEATKKKDLEKETPEQKIERIRKEAQASAEGTAAAKPPKEPKQKSFKPSKPVTPGAKQALDRLVNSTPDDQAKLIEIAQEALRRDPNDKDALDFLREAKVRPPEKQGWW